MGSSRLPGKVLKSILGRPMLQHMIERLAGSDTLDELVIATTVKPGDDVLEDFAKRQRVGCFRGSEEDVLARVRQAARQSAAAVIVKLSGDNPIYHPEFVDPIVRHFLDGTFDFVSNTAMGFSDKWREERTWPIGTGVSVFRTELLDRFDEAELDQADREHVIKYVIDRPDRFRLGAFQAEGACAVYARPELRFAVDTEADFEFIARLFEALYPSQPAFTLGDAIRYLDADPEVRQTNAHVRQRMLTDTASEAKPVR